MLVFLVENFAAIDLQLSPLRAVNAAAPLDHGVICFASVLSHAGPSEHGEARR